MKNKMENEIISREDFLKLPIGKPENKLLEIFQKEPNKAFKYLTLGKISKLKKSHVYAILNNLMRMELIEKRGEYYALKEERK